MNEKIDVRMISTYVRDEIKDYYCDIIFNDFIENHTNKKLDNLSISNEIKNEIKDIIFGIFTITNEFTIDFTTRLVDRLYDEIIRKENDEIILSLEKE